MDNHQVKLNTSHGVIVSKLDEWTIVSEFDSYLVPNSFGFGPYLS